MSNAHEDLKVFIQYRAPLDLEIESVLRPVLGFYPQLQNPSRVSRPRIVVRRAA